MLNLSAIKQFFEHKKVATLQELAKHFNEDQALIRCMLCHFINKGCVREKKLTNQCGTTCQKCDLANTVFYEWIKFQEFVIK